MFGMFRNVPQCSMFLVLSTAIQFAEIRKRFLSLNFIDFVNNLSLIKKNSSINKESNSTIKMTHLIHLSQKPVS